MMISLLLGVALTCQPGCKISQSCENGICVDPRWLPLSCASLPDDPIGLERSGPGCDSKGGNGTGLITVTALGPDGSPGTLRWAYNRINSRNRRVNCSSSLSGEIPLEREIKWQKPLTTLDFSACDVTVKPAPKTNGLRIAAVHNVIFYSIRQVGYFTGGGPNWSNPNNVTMFGLQGDTSPIKYPWDNLWESTPPVLRRAARFNLLDRLTATSCEDDCVGMMWEGVRDTTVSRSLGQGYHPSTLGAGIVPLPRDRWRLRVAHMYNVWYDSGERQTKPREQTHLWVYARNLVYNWSCVQTSNGHNTPMGLNISDDYTDENDLGWVVGSCFIPGPGSNTALCGNHDGWGIIVGNGLTCENCGNCDECKGYPTNYACCNGPKLANTRYWYEANEGSINEGGTNPPGYVPVSLPFMVDKARLWSRVLSEVGVVKRNSSERAIINLITGLVPAKCEVVQDHGSQKN